LPRDPAPAFNSPRPLATLPGRLPSPWPAGAALCCPPRRLTASSTFDAHVAPPCTSPRTSPRRPHGSPLAAHRLPPPTDLRSRCPPRGARRGVDRAQGRADVHGRHGPPRHRPERARPQQRRDLPHGHRHGAPRAPAGGHRPRRRSLSRLPPLTPLPREPPAPVAAHGRAPEI